MIMERSKMNEDSFRITDKSVLSDEDMAEFLQGLKRNDKNLKEEVFNLLRHENALRYFKYHVDQYCELHALAISQIEDLQEFTSFLKHENTFQKVVIERDKFYVDFFDLLLLPLIEVSAKFSENDRVFQETSKIIQKSIFSKNYKEFDSYLTEQFEQKKSGEKHKLCKSLFKFITSLYASHVCSFGFKLIFHSFSNTYNNFGLIYKFLIILTETIGFNIQEEFSIMKVKYRVTDPSIKKSLTILNEILDIAMKIKVDLEYKLNEITFSTFITNLLKSLLSLTGDPNSHCYQIFLKIAEINPLIIESVINEIIIYTMLGDNSNCKQEYEQFMIKIFEIFSKLHRIQNLISKMIPTLKSNIKKRELNETIYTFIGNVDVSRVEEKVLNVDDIFPQSVLNYFTNCILNLASWQVINLFKTLLYHLNTTADELPEMKGENSIFIYIEILSTLMCWVILSVRIAEHTVATGTVEKFVLGLEELSTILKKFGTALLHREHNHVLMRAFLNVCYHWAEIYMVLEYYSINNTVKMKKIIDKSAPADLTYLHPYLNTKEWCLIFERIRNFGEKPCKEMMQKMIIQKLKAILIFETNQNEEITTSLIKTLSVDFDASFRNIFMDKFVVNNVVPKYPPNVIMNISEVIVKDILEDRVVKEYIYDSQLLISGILTVVFSKINRLLKQKRKHDETLVKVARCSKIFGMLPTHAFLNDNLNEFFKESVEILLMEGAEQNLDLKINEGSIQKYLDTLKMLPLVFCNDNTVLLVVLLLLSLHRDVKESNCHITLARKCESFIICILQYNKSTLLELFEASALVKMIVDSFERFEDFFFHIIHNVFKNDESIENFQPGIEIIQSNTKDIRYLKLAVIVINVINKMKKSKISADSKELCSKNKSILCSKMTKTILKKKPENSLVEPYALVLKTYLNKDEDDNLPKLIDYLKDYVEFYLENLNDNNLKGGLILFITILHNKNILSGYDTDFVLKIWNTFKTATIKNEDLEEYCQLVMLITTLIPNEQFSKIFEDLLRVTDYSIDQKDHKDFFKHLRSWTCILSTNFNSVKTNLLRVQLESLMEKLIFVIKCMEYKEDLFEGIIQFEVSIIQTTHVPLTAVILDYLLSTIAFLMSRETCSFVQTYNMCMLLMENLLKHRNPLIMDRLPPYLLQYKFLLKELCKNSSSSLNLDKDTLQKIADCAHKLEKLTKSLVECSKDMARISMYLIADILGYYELDTLYPVVKKHLDNCIYSLMSLCDHHAVDYLMRVLSEASTEMFKIMYEHYKKYYRFTGKV